MNLIIKMIALAIMIIIIALVALLLKELHETDKELLEAEVRFLATHYSPKSQWEKSIEEVEELLRELYMAANPFGAVSITQHMERGCRRYYYVRTACYAAWERGGSEKADRI